MYEAFYQLQRRPFGSAPDVACCYRSPGLEAATQAVLHCLRNRQGLAVLSAQPGVGKSLWAERLATLTRPDWTVLLLRQGHFLTRRALLQTISNELGQSFAGLSEQELRLMLQPVLEQALSAGRPILLICDEAQQFSAEILEELRSLSDLAINGQAVVQVVLVGTLALDELLAEPALASVSQRIGCHAVLDPLTRAESIDYVDYRLTWAGGRSAEVFSTDALAFISEACDGLPRLIHQLCDHALLLGYIAQHRPAGLETLREALTDLRQLPLPWNTAVMLRASSHVEHEIAPATHPQSLDLDTTTAPESGPAITDVDLDGDLAEVLTEGTAHSEPDHAGWETVSAEWAQPDSAAWYEPGTCEPSPVEPGVETFADAAELTFAEADIKNVVADEIVDDTGSGTVSATPESVLETEETLHDRYASIDAGLPIPAEAAESDALANSVPAHRPFDPPPVESYAADDLLWGRASEVDFGSPLQSVSNRAADVPAADGAPTSPESLPETGARSESPAAETIGGNHRSIHFSDEPSDHREAESSEESAAVYVPDELPVFAPDVAVDNMFPLVAAAIADGRSEDPAPVTNEALDALTPGISEAGLAYDAIALQAETRVGVEQLSSSGGDTLPSADFFSRDDSRTGSVEPSQPWPIEPVVGQSTQPVNVDRFRHRHIEFEEVLSDDSTVDHPAHQHFERAVDVAREAIVTPWQPASPPAMAYESLSLNSPAPDSESNRPAGPVSVNGANPYRRLFSLLRRRSLADE